MGSQAATPCETRIKQITDCVASAVILYFWPYAVRPNLWPKAFHSDALNGDTVNTTSLKFSLYFAIVLVFAGCAGHPPSRGLSVAITGAPTTVAPNQVVTLGAIVNGDKTNAGVTWGVSGSGTFTSTTNSLTYTAPATVPTSPTVTVTATSITDPTRSASVTFTIAVAAVSVSITNPISTIVAGGAAANLGATVTNDVGTAGVAWTLVTTGTTTACSPTCGTISGATTTGVTYTPPPTVAATIMASIVATSNADNTKSAIDAFTVTQPGAVAVTITNPITTATAGSTTNIVLNATVANDVGAAGVTWQLVTGGTTTACSPDCGTMVSSTTTSFTYLPPATVPTNPSTSIIATSVADNTKSTTDTFTIQAQAASDLSFLSGPYAFVMSGFDANGAALTLAGSINADGKGKIISGEIDVNDNFAVTNTTIISGTYTLDGNLRGVITLAQPLSAFSNTATFAFTIDSATNTGTIMGADEGEPAVSGFLASQSPAVASALPSGNFILRGSSDALQTRLGLVGRFTIGGGGAISAGLVDSADILNGNDSQDATLTGTFVISDANGRGTVTLAQAGSTSSNLAYYAISPTKMFLIEINNDSNTQVVGVARAQNLSSLTAGSVNGTGVFGLIGGDDGGQPGAQFASVAIGQAVISGGATASVSCDINDAGDVTFCGPNETSPAPITGTVTFDATTGRGTITIPSGYEDGFVDSLVFYLEANGTGVLLDTTGFADAGSPDSLPEALVGDLTPQTSTTAISGTIQGVATISQLDIPVAVAAASATGESITGLVDAQQADSEPFLDVPFTGEVSAVDSTGRATVELMDNDGIFIGEAEAVAYAISPTQFYLIGTTSDGTTDDLDFVSSLGVFTSQTLPSVQAASKPKSASPSPTPQLRKPRGMHRRTRPNAVHPTAPTAR